MSGTKEAKDSSKEESSKEAKDSSIPSLEEKDSYRRRLFEVVKHVNKVNESAELLAERIIERAQSEEDFDFARRLIQQTRKHDLSKFEGIEWESLRRGVDDNLLKIAIHQHQQTNYHHPEYFVGGISQMNDLQIAEMVCDWKSRSTEAGTCLRSYIKERATVRWGFTTKSNIYRKIMKYVNLLLDDQFK